MQERGQKEEMSSKEVAKDKGRETMKGKKVAKGKYFDTGNGGRGQGLRELNLTPRSEDRSYSNDPKAFCTNLLNCTCYTKFT